MSTALLSAIDSALVETGWLDFANAEYLMFSAFNSFVFCSMSVRAVSMGDISAVCMSITSDRLKTVGNVSSVVKKVFTTHVSSSPFGLTFVTGRWQLKMLIALEI